MSVKIILRLLSLLFLLLCVPLAACAAVAFFCDEPLYNLLAFLGPVGGAVVFALIVHFGFGQRGLPSLTAKAGFLFVCLAWMSVSLFGCIPFMVSGLIPDFTRAFFEATSGFTTTGTIIAVAGDIPLSLALWNTLMQWMGGMGIVVLTVAIFPLLGFGGLSLMEAETPGPSVAKLSPRIAASAKILWLIYLGFTVVLALLLLAGGFPLFEAITRAMATVSTGGGNPVGAQAELYSSRYIQIVLMIFMLLGGMSFPLHYKIITGKLRDVAGDFEWRVYLGIVLVVSFVIAFRLLLQYIYTDAGESLLVAAFHVSSLLSTTGFCTQNFATWGSLPQILLMLLLFVGGCSGSTSGGIKIIRILTLFKMAVAEMKYMVHPRGMFGVFVNGQYLRKNIVYNCAALVFLYFVVFVVVAIVVASGGYDMVTSFATSLAFLSNTGVGFGLAGPFRSFEFLPPYIMWTLNFAMLIGRLEVYTFLVILTPAFWRK